MMAFVGTLIFIGAMMTALGTMWLTIAPQWQRVLRLATGRHELPLRPFEQLVDMEHPIAVRRRAAQTNLVPMPAMMPAPIRLPRAA